MNRCITVTLFTICTTVIHFSISTYLWKRLREYGESREYVKRQTVDQIRISQELTQNANDLKEKDLGLNIGLVASKLKL